MGFITFKEKAYGYFSQTGSSPEALSMEMFARPIAGGLFTTAGGDTAEAITVDGLLTSDIVIVQLQTPGLSPVTVRGAVAASGQINVTMSADPSTDHILQWIAFRPF